MSETGDLMKSLGFASLIVIGIFGIVISSYFVLSSYGGDAVAQIDQQIQVSKNSSLRAMVKGSIYGDQEFMTVYGTCLDGYDLPVENATAYFSSWYPNGTVRFYNDSMTEITTGYFIWNGQMPNVGGTYLTEFDCVKGNDMAKAFGEWQNPDWVRQINTINNTVTGLANNLSNLTTVVVTGFNETNNNLNILQENVTNNLNYTNYLIMDSVDRNNSLLAYLLYLLINGTGSPVTGNLTWDDYSVDSPVKYWNYWNIKTRVYDEYGHVVSDPDVYCQIVTNMHSLQNMDVEGEHFSARLFINQMGPLDYTTTCYRT